MAHTACLVVKVSYVNGSCKKPLEKQALVAGTNKAGRPTRQLGLPALFCARLLCFVPATSACSSKWISHSLMHLEQSTFLRYLWSGLSLTRLAWLSHTPIYKCNILYRTGPSYKKVDRVGNLKLENVLEC